MQSRAEIPVALPVEPITRAKPWRAVFFAAAILGGALFFRFVNPQAELSFLHCPFLALTGLQCPGCGTMRGLHALMHGEFVRAFALNPMAMVMIPVLIFYAGRAAIFPEAESERSPLPMQIIAGVVIIFWVLRLIF
jgi:Protein of unknown function (DUF2752)